MVDWLVQNKEWVFSGVGVTLLFALTNFLVNFRSKERGETGVSVRIADVESGTSNSRSLEPNPQERFAPVTPQEIQATIESAPPLQADSVASRYQGLRVEWDTELSQAEKNDELVQLMVRALGTRAAGSRSVFVWCTVRLEEYQELAIAPPKTRIRVRGVIQSASATAIKLSDASLSIQPPNRTA